MKKPLFSIIIPVFNIEKYIGRCIESVKSQEFNDWELIIVDDGSSDNTLTICQSFASKDDRIRVISQKNAGVSSARNRGLDEAIGEYIAFIDGDDYWIDCKYLDTVKQSSSIDVIYNPNLVLQYPKGAKRENIGYEQFVESEIHENPAQYLARFLKNRRWGCVLFIIKKSIIDQAGTRFNENIQIGEDADWVFRTIMNACCMRIINNVNYVYCVNRTDSTMTVKSPKALCSFFEMTKTWKALAEKNTDLWPIYTMFCNNAMDYFHTFGVYKKDDQIKLVHALMSSGAYECANSPGAYDLRKLIDKHGINRCIFVMGLRYRIRLIGSRVKGMLLRNVLELNRE